MAGIVSKLNNVGQRNFPQKKYDLFIIKLMINYNLGFAGFIGVAKVLAPLVFNLRRYTLSAEDTYNILKSGPPKQTLDACPFEGGTGMIAFTRPS
jgi:hypothetical protein